MASIDGGNVGSAGAIMQNPYAPGGSLYGSRSSDAQTWAWQALYNQLGRPPTQTELAQAAPAYMGADKNIMNVQGGDAFVAQMVQQLNAQNPQQSGQTAQTAANQQNQNVQAQYQNLEPTLQQDYLQPLQQMIQQQQGQQQNLTQQALGQQQGLNQQAMGQQQGLNQDYMNQLRGIDTTQNNLLGQQMESARNQLATDLGPNNPLGQKLMGEFNNYGITPQSGAFQSALGSQFGDLAAQQQQDILGQGIAEQGQLASAAGAGQADLSSLLGQGQAPLQNILGQGLGTQSQLGLGNLNAQQGALQMPTNLGINEFNAQQGQGFNLQNALQQQGFNQTDFNQQSTLAQLLSQQGNPSTAQSILGMASGAAQGAGALGQGYGAAKSGTSSYVCRELVRRGLLCDHDLEDFYYHLFDAVWYKARAFWHYRTHGQELVDLVNVKGLDWQSFKPLLFDRVMEEPDACAAVDLFSDACHQLCISVDPTLWDGRVLRTSLVDSLPFLPLLFTDTTFGGNFWKILRMKMLWVYDKPRCEFHR